MEKVREFFGLLKRQHFWFLAPILLIMALVGWWLSAKKLSAEFSSNKSTVQGYLSQMQTVSGEENHPNPIFHQGMDALIQQRRDNVRAAWQTKWERQKQELKWPEQLPAEFRRQVEQMRPIEKVDPVNTPQHEIPASLRRTYGGFIKNVLPELAASIGARWQPQTGGRRGLRGFDTRSRGNSPREDGPAQDESQIVLWNPANQGLFDQQFNWGTRPPTTHQVLYAQEDLWVLTTLIDIIQRTNRDAPTRSQAAVKEIEFIQIANNVDPPEFKVLRPAPVVGASAGGDDDDALDRVADEPAATSSTDSAEVEETEGQAESEALNELVKNRYVNENYEPIPNFQTLLSSATVAKRIPVRIRVKIDQRRIARLLVECANSPLTFEVRQFRLNPQDDRLGSGRLGGETVDPFGTERGAGLMNVKKLPDYQSFDRIVELFGIVYIFNPVSEEVLGGSAPESVSDELALNLSR